ncbi:hypothetical protein [Haloferula sp.]|uniref:hypothetical protein n=1 Tax=Haloferula sp. TaxID=2497595 RepID=UPI0032A017E3
MKVSILISVLILAIAGMFGWQGMKQLDRVKSEHGKVVREAAALGISAGDEIGSGGGRKPLVRERKDRELAARNLAEEVIAFAKRMKEAEDNGEGPGEELEKETMAMMKRFLDLDAHQLKSLIGVLRESSEIDDEMRNGIVGFSIMMLANESPEAALTLYTETSDMLEMDGMDEHVVTSALSQWAEKDAFGALDWIRENGEKNPDLVTDEVKAGVIAGAARQDPTLALGLIDELDVDADHGAATGIAQSARTPEERTSLMKTLRVHEGQSGKEGHKLKRSILSSMGSQLASEGFERSSEWIENAEMSVEETTAIFSGISYHQTKEDTGKWISWASENVEEKGDLNNKVKYMMANWTRNDFEAAGTWLNDAEEGPAKETAMVSYAETVAPYEPESAAEWALILPEGKERTKLLKQVHREWKKKDEAAAAAFAAEQGIE